MLLKKSRLVVSYDLVAFLEVVRLGIGEGNRAFIALLHLLHLLFKHLDCLYE